MRFFLNRDKEENLFLENLKINIPIVVSGPSGCGKTFFINNILNKNNYTIINYSLGETKIKHILENIINNSISKYNILNNKKQVIVIDNIDIICQSDKNGFNILLKYFKKTLKQNIPIIISTSCIKEKKIIELINLCFHINLDIITDDEILQIINKTFVGSNPITILKYINKNLFKLHESYTIFQTNSNYEFKDCNFINNTKELTKNIIVNNYKLNDHSSLINDTERTIVGLLWHENIINIFNKKDIDFNIRVYYQILQNICFSDYIDRITFQKQVWIFNEMGSLIKIFKNSFFVNSLLNDKKYCKYFKTKKEMEDISIEFTKILTKYSTQFNNEVFITLLSQELLADKKDLINYFLYLKETFEINQIYDIISNINPLLTKIHVNRIYKYIETNIINEPPISEWIEEELFDHLLEV